MTHPIAHVQTKREISELLSQAGLSPTKRFGQNFLIDGNLMRKLVASAQIVPSDMVVEIGAGTGGLTDLLVASGAQVVAVEIDKGLHAVLEDRFNGSANFTLLYGDALQSKHTLRPDLAEMIRTQGGVNRRTVKLVANLPYHIATPIVMNLLVDFPEVKRLCFTVQSELADRILSDFNCKAFGPLSIISQLLATVSKEAKLPCEAFWPRPDVVSAMLRMDVQQGVWCDRSALKRFVALVRSVFEHRRKTLRAALKYVADEAVVDRVCSQFKGSGRPESFRPAEWVKIFEVFDGVDLGDMETK